MIRTIPISQAFKVNEREKVLKTDRFYRQICRDATIHQILREEVFELEQKYYGHGKKKYYFRFFANGDENLGRVRSGEIVGGGTYESILRKSNRITADSRGNIQLPWHLRQKTI